MKKKSHSCGSTLCGMPRTGDTHQDCLRGDPAEQKMPLRARWTFPAAQVAWQGAAVAKMGASLQKALLSKALLLLLMEFRFLCSYCVSLTLNSKNLKEEDSLQGINLRYPELHEQSQICALFYQKLNFDLLQWNIMRNTFGNKLK